MKCPPGRLMYWKAGPCVMVLFWKALENWQVGASWRGQRWHAPQDPLQSHFPLLIGKVEGSLHDVPPLSTMLCPSAEAQRPQTEWAETAHHDRRFLLSCSWKVFWSKSQTMTKNWNPPWFWISKINAEGFDFTFPYFQLFRCNKHSYQTLDKVETKNGNRDIIFS